MFTKYNVWPTTRVKKILKVHPDNDYMRKNIDLCDVSLDNTSDSEEPVNSTMTATSIGIENNSKATHDSVATTTAIMSEENNKTWYNAKEECDSWHNTTETMDNYQEWINPPT